MAARASRRTITLSRADIDILRPRESLVPPPQSFINYHLICYFRAPTSHVYARRLRHSYFRLRDDDDKEYFFELPYDIYGHDYFFLLFFSTPYDIAAFL